MNESNSNLKNNFKKKDLNKHQLTTSLGRRIAYSNGPFVDTLSAITWGFLGFTFYFAVVGLPIVYITIAIIILTFWDAFNDPIMGVISDRTKSRYGRRKFWLYIVFIPMVLVNILLWTPPLGSSTIILFIYFLAIAMIFDLIYTCFTVNNNALWPEMFLTVEERTKIGLWRNFFSVMGASIAYLIPSLIIIDMANRHNLAETPGQYVLNGIIISIIVLISFAIFLKWGVFERTEFSRDAEKAPPLIDSLKITFKNKAFVVYVIIELCIFCIYFLLLALMPLYGTYVLGLAEENSFLIGLIVLVCLILGFLFTPVWMFLQKKYGIRKCFIICLSYWAVTFLLIMTANDIFTGFLYFSMMGPALGGAIYLYEQGVAEIIDDDSVRSGLDARREGSYYGISGLINRFAAIFNILMISIVFTRTGWGEYNPNPGADVILGLRFLMGIYPIIIIGVAIFCLYLYPIHGKRLDENKLMLLEQRSIKQKDMHDND